MFVLYRSCACLPVVRLSCPSFQQTMLAFYMHSAVSLLSLKHVAKIYCETTGCRRSRLLLLCSDCTLFFAVQVYDIGCPRQILSPHSNPSAPYAAISLLPRSIVLHNASACTADILCCCSHFSLSSLQTKSLEKAGDGTIKVNFASTNEGADVRCSCWLHLAVSVSISY